MLHLFGTIALRILLFQDSFYDPLSKLSRPPKGYFSQHAPKDTFIESPFGDISILTLNAYKKIPVEIEETESVNNIITLIDSVHPTIFALQAVNEEMLRILYKNMQNEKHYKIINTEKSFNDAISGSKYYLPIIYDNEIVQIKKHNYFESGSIYASYVVVMDRRYNKEYTVINIDLYSSFPDIVSAQFFNILGDIKMTEIGKKPVVLAGNIGAMDKKVKRMTEISYKNVLNTDMNNKKLDLTTDHTNGNNDNIERSYILLKDLDMMEVNYARILSEYKRGDFYPVYSILTMKNVNDNIVGSAQKRIPIKYTKDELDRKKKSKEVEERKKRREEREKKEDERKKKKAEEKAGKAEEKAKEDKKKKEEDEKKNQEEKDKLKDAIREKNDKNKEKDKKAEDEKKKQENEKRKNDQKSKENKKKNF